MLVQYESLGEDIMAACGQLKSATEKERKSKKTSVVINLN